MREIYKTEMWKKISKDLSNRTLKSLRKKRLQKFKQKKGNKWERNLVYSFVRLFAAEVKQFDYDNA